MLKSAGLANDGARITVLQLITGLGVGGAERVVMELAGKLNGEEIRSLVVVLNSQRGEMLGQYPNLSFPVFRMGMKRNPWSFFRTLIEVSRIIKTEAVEVVHAHMFHSVVIGLLCKLLNPRVRLVFTSHTAKGFSRLRRALINGSKFFRDADVIFVRGQHHEMNAANTVVIPNGVDVAKSKDPVKRPGNTRPVLLFVGRLEPVKNPIALVRQFAAMSNKDCELWMVGDGVLRSKVESEIESLGVHDRVRLLGLRNDVADLMRQADCFVMTSLWEGLPMAMLEAGAVGLPVVAPPVGAIPEVLDGKCGYLVGVSDLHTVLDEVLIDYFGAVVRGDLLRKKVIARYSLEHMCSAHSELYRSVIN